MVRSSRRLVTVLAIVSALAVGMGLGAVLFARSGSGKGSESGQALERPGASSASSGEVADGVTGAEEPPAVAGGSGGATSAPLSQAFAEGTENLPIVQPANQPVYAYQEADAGRRNTGTVPPPTLPVTVRMSSTSDLVDGQPVAIRVEAKNGSKMYGFEARICRADATFRGLYDFFPTVAGTCAAEPLSAGSDAYLRVQGQEPYESAEGVIRIGMGSNTFMLEDDRPATVSCDRSNLCKLVLMIQVPYGFGFQEYPLSYR